MKKFAFIIILALVASVSMIGCTEQEVKPKGTTQTVVSDPYKG